MKSNLLNFRLLLIWIISALLLVSCGGASGGSNIGGTPGGNDVTNVKLVSITINIDSLDIATNTNAYATAVGMFSNGVKENISSMVIWAAEESSILSVGSTGVLKGLKPGTTVISATYDGISSNRVTVSVTDKTLKTINLTVKDATLPLGATTQSNVIGHYDNNTQQNLTEQVVYQSSNTSVARVESSGVITSVGVGTATITASYNGIISSTNIQVIDVKLEKLQVSIKENGIAAGTSTTLVATGYYSNNTQIDLSNSVTWSLSDTKVAKIEVTGGIATIQSLYAGKTEITATANNGITSEPVTLSVLNAVLQKLEITVDDNNIPAGNKVQARAIGIFSDGNQRELTQDVVWTSASQKVLNIDEFGTITARQKGNTFITASLGLVSVQYDVSVIDATLQKITINTAKNSLPVGMSTTLTAQGDYSDSTNSLITSSVDWKSDDTTIINIDKNGNVTAGSKAGTTKVRASLNGVVSEDLTFTVTQKTLTDIAISLDNSSFVAGSNAQATAIGYYNNNTHDDITSSVMWNTNDNNIATINKDGLVNGISTGKTNITAELGGVSAKPVEISVLDAVLNKVALTIDENNISAGYSGKAYAQGYFSNGTSQNLSADGVVWSSSARDVANVMSDGTIIALKKGTTYITATYRGITSDPYPVQVTDARLIKITINADKNNLPLGTTALLTAEGTYSDQNNMPIGTQVNWKSSNTQVINVDSSGNVSTGTTTGTATVSASINGVTSNTIEFTVVNPVLNSVEVNLQSNNIAAGITTSATAIGVYSDGKPRDITTDVVWSSSSSIANIDKNGLITGNSPGSVTITANYLGKSNSKTLTVSEGVLKEITIDGTNQIAKGNSVSLNASGKYSDGSKKQITSSVSWSSDDLSTVTIDSNGNIKGIKKGTANISANINDIVSAKFSVTVTDAMLQSIQVSVDDSSKALGVSGKATAIGHYSDGTTPDISSKVLWSSDSPSTVNVKSDGTFTTNAVGSSMIGASLSGINSNKIQINVSAAKLTSLELNVDTRMPNVAEYVQAHVTGHYSDGSTQDLTKQVTWYTDDSAVEVDANGVFSIHKEIRGLGYFILSASYNGITSNEVSLITKTNQMKSLTINVDDNSIIAGSTANLAATLTFADGSSKSIDASSVDWTSSSPSTVNVVDGKVVANKAGTVTLSGSYDSWLYFGSRVYSNDITITVTGKKLGSITINARDSKLVVGTTTDAIATGVYTDGTDQNITDMVSWTSSDTSVINPSIGGLLKANKAGTAILTATYKGVTSNQILVTVTPATLSKIDVQIDNAKIPLGLTAKASATGTYSDGSQQDITDQVLWTSADNTVIAMSSGGITQSIKTGSTSIKASFGNISSAMLPVTVVKALPSSMAIELSDTSSVAAGTTLQAKLKAKFTDGSSMYINNNNIGWTSSDTTIANITSEGEVQANKVGTVTINATHGGSSVMATVNVTNAKLTGLTINSSTSIILAGSKVSMSATGSYTDRIDRDITNDVTWSVDNSSIANISANGVITANSYGTVTVTASSNGFKATKNITISGLSSISLEVSQTSIFPNGKTTYKVMGYYYPDNKAQDITNSSNLKFNYDGSVLSLPSSCSGCTYFIGNKVGSSNLSVTYNDSINSNIFTSNVVKVNVVEDYIVSLTFSAPRCLGNQWPSDKFSIYGRKASGEYFDLSFKDVKISRYDGQDEPYRRTLPWENNLVTVSDDGEITKKMGIQGNVYWLLEYQGMVRTAKTAVAMFNYDPSDPNCGV